MSNSEKEYYRFDEVSFSYSDMVILNLSLNFRKQCEGQGKVCCEIDIQI